MNRMGFPRRIAQGREHRARRRAQGASAARRGSSSAIEPRYESVRGKSTEGGMPEVSAT